MQIPFIGRRRNSPKSPSSQEQAREELERILASSKSEDRFAIGEVFNPLMGAGNYTQEELPNLTSRALRKLAEDHESAGESARAAELRKSAEYAKRGLSYDHLRKH